MHMADALLTPEVAGTMYACSAAAMGYSVKKIHNLDEPEKVPVMGVMGAFVFAAQMINFTIPGTGASGHLCGGILLTAVLGPQAAFLTLIGVLLVQCLFFADGGLLALGANIWNMAFYGCFLGGMLIWKPIMKKGMSKRKIIAASIAGCIVTLQLGALSVTLETLASGITELPFGIFVATMQPIHFVIGLVEGLITASVLVFVYEARPELLWSYGITEKKAKLSYKKVIIIMAGAALLIGGGVSVFASANPDGLEWSMEKVAGASELTASGKIYDMAAAIQKDTAVLPEYALKNREGTAGTTISGIVGSMIVIVLCVVVCCGLKLFVRKHRKDENGS